MTIILAFLLDAFWGDPSWLPHPVIAMGRLITALDNQLLDNSHSPRKQLWRGLLLVIIVVAATWAAAVSIVYVASVLHKIAGQFLIVMLMSTTIAAKSLAKAAYSVFLTLAKKDLPASRHAVSMIVGRDTENLSAAEVARAAVETVAENTVDGVTAPIFYALIGGLPLALMYKAVNTMDSMLGHRTDRYLYFGRAAAKLDDAANWLPARLTVLAMLFAALILRFDYKAAWSSVKNDGRKHPSPNSGLAEAFTAGALSIRLGGESQYGRHISKRPQLNIAGRLPVPGDIVSAARLMQATSVIFLITGFFLRYYLV